MQLAASVPPQSFPSETTNPSVPAEANLKAQEKMARPVKGESRRQQESRHNNTKAFWCPNAQSEVNNTKAFQSPQSRTELSVRDLVEREGP